MWERKKSETGTATAGRGEQEYAPAPTTQGAAPVPAARTVEPVRTGTAIGKAVTIIGDIASEEDLYVDGEVQGKLDIRNSRLTIGPNGKAKSNVKAREVIIQGQVHGDVEATQKITIRREGSLVGNIKTTGIVIEDDAYFKGSIDIVRKEMGQAAG